MSEPRDTRFKPGQSGNPGGRPKGAISLTAEIRRQMAQTDEDRRTVSERVVAACIDKALEGSVQHFIQLIERTDGKVSTGVELETPAGIVVELRPRERSE